MSGLVGRAALRFHLLGHIRASVHGDAYAIATPRKTPQLLGYLLLHRGATVSRDYLAFLFWPDDTEEAAKAKLRSNLFDLTRVLPPAPQNQPWIAADGTSVRWNVQADLALDVDDFDAAIAARDLETAVALYDGDLLEGFYDEWLIAPRERLRSAYLSALSDLISEARRGMNYSAAIAHAKRLLQAEPLREDVARRLIALRYEAGDRAGALDEYVRFAGRLREELVIEPMPETAMLHAAIVRNEPLPAAERLQAGHPASAARAPSLLPFVGREDELSRLLDGWNRAARGRGGIALVDGAPGIGKSRLVAQLARCVEERGGRVLAGTTGFPEAMPYQALLEALRSALPLLAAARLDAVSLRVLSTLMSELAHLVEEHTPPATLSPESERARTLGALAQAVVALAQPRPLLLILEDVHWAQDATIAALGVLSRRTPHSQVFVVATYREGDVPRRHALRTLRAEVLGAGWGSGLTLRPLSAVEVAEVARNVASPLAESPQDLRAACAGNPLILDQLLASRADAIPSNGELRLDAIVGAQVERLSGTARSFAEIAALVGARFPQELVREVGGWDAGIAVEALDELLDHKIINEVSGYGEYDYAFAHQLVRDAVADHASARRAPDRHRRIARALEMLYPEREAELAAQTARHYDLAGDGERAASRYVAAGRRALAMSAVEEARAALRRGLELATGANVRAAAFIDLIEVSRRTGNAAERAAALAGLEEAVALLDDPESRRTAALLRVQLSASDGDRSEQSKTLEHLRAVASDGGARWRAVIALEETRAALAYGDFEAATATADAALRAARESADDSTVARALVAIARLRASGADIAGVQLLLDEAQEAAFRAGDGLVELEALAAAHQNAFQGEDLERALPVTERWLQRATALGDRHAEAYARVRLGVTLLALRQDLRRVVDILASLDATYEELGSRYWIAKVSNTEGVIAQELGDLTRAADSYLRAYEHFEAVANRSGAVGALSCHGMTRARAGDPPRGRRDAIAALDRVREGRYDLLEAGMLENLAITHALCGDVAEAIRIGREALAMHERLSTHRWRLRLLGDLAVWCARTGDLGSARRYVDEMLAGTLPLTTEFPQTCPWAAAQILRACGETDAAASQLERAYQLVATVAAELRDEDRIRFEAVSWNREIIGAHDRDEWPPLLP